jgi:DNA repair protein SbcC/Rad50
MIPTRLTLRNFMSYGDEPTEIDFAGMHVACLSGDNGNGKSAILDAMTYALWGKTRASGSQASGEDDLIRLGAQDLEVALEFRVMDAAYRSVRKRTRGRGGDWQLALCDGEGVWRPAGGSGVRDTERTIARLLRMEYETFLNSAYFQQGRADEFTRQRPDARKRILCDILELGRYDRLEELAREARANADAAMRELDGELRLLQGQIDEEPILRTKLETAHADQATATAAHTAAEQELALLRAQLAAMDEKARRVAEREQRARELERGAEQLSATIEQLDSVAQRADATIAAGPAIVADNARLGELRGRAAALEPEVRRLNALERERVAAEASLARCRQQIEGEIRVVESDLKHARDAAAGLARIEGELATVTRQLADLAGCEADLIVAQMEHQSAVDEFAALKAENDRLQGEIADLIEVVELLGGAGSACPICGSDLSGERRAHVEERQRARLDEAQARKRENTTAGGAAKRRRDALQNRVSDIAGLAQRAAGLREKETQLAARRKEAEVGARRTTELEQTATELRRRLTAGEFGQNEREALAGIDATLAELRAAVEEHRDASVEIARLTGAQVERRFAELQAAERERAQTRVRIETAHRDLAERRERISAEQIALRELVGELAEHARIRASATASEVRAREADAARVSARAAVERYDHMLIACARAREEAHAKRQEHERLGKDRQAYTDLTAAFGKRGVQALIIDNALPEIQEEANRLLARMTDNAMQLTLSTLRQARAGKGQIETLDISITDDIGTRPYEMFSGGEGFRVNFALRIALSRMLTRRAGAPLQTLVIDEGFGTQDTRGLDRLVESIDAIKDEFALILVISHIESLKEAFATRIDVVKTPTGSHINYVD